MDSDRLTSLISTDAEALTEISQQSGAVRQPSSSVPSSQQFYTGIEENQDSKTPPDTTSSFSLPKLTREEFIKQHWNKLPKELKVGFYDVMVLYSEAEYLEAEHFRDHLEKEIFPNEPGKIKAVLYDGPELEGLSSSMLKHLDGGFQRCTFTFIYLTKMFVECDYCNLSSDSCLMEAIYDKEKKWCVVPVYTVQRNKADFRVPMGLNSLKGINFYNADEFYRKGVRRLIGDKLYKREESDKKHQEICYNYLVRKVQFAVEYEQKLLAKHEYEQRVIEMKDIESERKLKEHYRSQSTMEQTDKNVGYAPEMNLKPDMHSSIQSTDNLQKYRPSESGPYSRKSGPTSMDVGDITADYQSAPPHSNAQSRPVHLPKSEVHCFQNNQSSGINIHCQQYYKHATQEPEPIQPPTNSITADNVTVGDQGKNLVGGQPVDMKEFRVEIGSKDGVPSESTKGKRGDQGGMPSSVSADVDFPKNQSSGTSTAALFCRQS